MAKNTLIKTLAAASLLTLGSGCSTIKYNPSSQKQNCYSYQSSDGSYNSVCIPENNSQSDNIIDAGTGIARSFLEMFTTN